MPAALSYNIKRDNLNRNFFHYLWMQMLVNYVLRRVSRCSTIDFGLHTTVELQRDNQHRNLHYHRQLIFVLH